ncbi:MAG: DUF4159 domain-containing protein [Bacteroidia bacterium]|nr:DUF4159 domain-containing protein [Bacteroidia bacterium]MCX7651553.1 DUF4159 domain-containing protein [Bacteroidia bacterium]MDW8416251.1 DUF4159 domain-containing protein [Bacteroidia bacterium]
MRFVLVLTLLWAQSRPAIKVGKLQYGGGGDWYGNRASLSNLLKYVQEHAPIPVQLQEEVVRASAPNLSEFVLLYASGHGNIEFSPEETDNLRRYLLRGGFLLIDDDYGMHEYAKRALLQILPDGDFQVIPDNHPIFRCYYDFPFGLPKVHEHDNKVPQFYGLFHKGRLVAALTYEADLGDGWEDPQVHKDPPEVRELAFKMGVNILCYILTYPW